MTCPICGASIVWAHQSGQPNPFELATPGRYLILKDEATNLSDLQADVVAMWDGPRYENHLLNCKPKK